MGNIHEIKQTGKMLVPGIVFASDKLFEDMKKDKTLEQVKNVAQLPGIIDKSIAMPDAHEGYGFCIGGVAAFDVEKGVVSPGGVGYDINCSVRLLRTNLKSSDVKNWKEILHSLFRCVPSGVGQGSKLKLSDAELNEVLSNGAQWAVEKGYGVKEDYLHTEDEGRLNGGNPKDISQRARARGKGQLGTLGAGNHFLEIQVVDEVFDEEIAKTFGLKKGEVTIMVHCGSRGLGHQVASDYIQEMEKKIGVAGLPDRELVNAPIKSELGGKYLSAMACAANFAFANKQLITHWIREDLKHYFPKIKIEVVYDVCHNIAKFEKHFVDGHDKEVLVMRKGATRAFGPGRAEIPADYRSVGQPVILPGSMGTSSYVLVGTKESEKLSWGSTAHGAGRLMSRSAAKKKLNAGDVKRKMSEQGIILESGSTAGIVEEAAEAYKDVDEVVRVSDELGIGKMVVRLKPLAVMKG
ncbi:RtcB family protein [Candidatus Pacearchaeota archaeon]|nr:RtcB family protein [Candidatus Pacearchaeota archaeon]